MSPPMMIQIVLIASAVTTFGCAAYWATTSPRHWFLRASFIAMMLGATLLVSAPELFVTFACLVLVVAGGIGLGRWRMRRIEQTHTVTRQVSLTSLFLVMILGAALFAAVPSFSPLRADEWVHGVWHGSLSGFGCLLAIWFVGFQNDFPSPKKRLRFIARIVLAACALMLITMAVSLVDYVTAILVGEVAFLLPVRDVFHSHWRYSRNVSLTAFAVLATSLYIGHRACRPVETQQMPAQFCTVGSRLLWRLLMVVFGLVVLAPTVYLYFWMINSPAVPDELPPVPNAYDAFISIGDGITPAAAADAPALDQLQSALQMECLVPIRYRRGKFPPELYPAGLNRLTESLFLRLESALLTENYALATETFLQIVRYEHLMNHGTTQSEFDFNARLVRFINFPEILKHTDKADTRRIAFELGNIEAETEPLHDIETRTDARDANWHWTSRLDQVIAEVCGESDISEAQFRFRYQFRRAIVREWMLASVIRNYWFEYNQLPAELDELVPDFCERIPTNPLDPNQERLQYERLGECEFAITALMKMEVAYLPKTPVRLVFEF